MHDLALVGFILGIIALGMRKPFIFVLGYAYVDIVSPQRLSYYLLNAVPISLIFFVLAVGGYLAADDKTGARLSGRQVLLILLLLWCGYTTATADFPAAALEKWDWVWKALVFAIFLPFTLRTRLRIEGLLLFMVVSASSIIVVGGVKTVLGGGGYGTLNLGPRATMPGCTRARRSRPLPWPSCRSSSISAATAPSFRGAGSCGSTRSRWCSPAC